MKKNRGWTRKDTNAERVGFYSCEPVCIRRFSGSGFDPCRSVVIGGENCFLT